jgi:hypothetical protein
MNVQELIKYIKGELLTTTSDLNREIKGGCGADLMSDVLASIQPDAVLLTGLCNPQVVFVRGKKPSIDTIDLAEKECIPLITSPFGMFELSGRLYQAGLPSLEMPINP